MYRDHCDFCGYRNSSVRVNNHNNYLATLYPLHHRMNYGSHLYCTLQKIAISRSTCTAYVKSFYFYCTQIERSIIILYAACAILQNWILNWIGIFFYLRESGRRMVWSGLVVLTTENLWPIPINIHNFDEDKSTFNYYQFFVHKLSRMRHTNAVVVKSMLINRSVYHGGCSPYELRNASIDSASLLIERWIGRTRWTSCTVLFLSTHLFPT